MESKSFQIPSVDTSLKIIEFISYSWTFKRIVESGLARTYGMSSLLLRRKSPVDSSN